MTATPSCRESLALDVSVALRMSETELESRRSVLLDKLETLPPTSGMRY